MLRPVWVLGVLMSLGAGCSASSDAGLRPPDGNVQGSTKPKSSSGTSGTTSGTTSRTSSEGGPTGSSAQTSTPGVTTERGGVSSTSAAETNTSQSSSSTAGSSSSGASSSGATSSRTGSTQSTGSGTSTKPPTCGHAPAHTCSKPINCVGWARCGGLERFDALGCQRSDCVNDSECAAGERCYRALDFGGCASSNVTCSDLGDGNCECVVTDDCAGSYCVPASEYPG